MADSIDMAEASPSAQNLEFGFGENPDFGMGENPDFTMIPEDEANEQVVYVDDERNRQSGDAKTGNYASPEMTTPGMRLMSLLCLVGGLEGADGVLLPCVLISLQRDLEGITLSKLALMSMVQALAGNIASPLWGVLADRGTMKRKSIIVIGCVAQGLITVALAFVDSFALMMILRAFNGAMLASLRPIANGIVADVTAEIHRGKVYGFMGIAMNVGTMAGTLIGTNLARHMAFGMQGWRVAFLIVGIASVIVGFVALALMKEPPRSMSGTQAKGKGWGAVKAEMRELGTYFKMPSFCVLILQGCFGTVPWNALGYKTLFFQLGGISDLQASLIDVFSQVAGSLGGLLGGCIGDGMSRCSRNHGRPITAQISVLAGIPVAWFIFMAHPPEDGAFAYYLMLMVTLGLTATWCGVGVNLPILSQIVKDDRRATIMAWEGTLESSCSAIFGNAMVGFLAQNVFGYDLENAEGANGSSTDALGKALMLVSFFPWMLCFACYSLLHWSYPRDLKWLAEQDRLKEEFAVKAVEEPHKVEAGVAGTAREFQCAPRTMAEAAIGVAGVVVAC